MKKTPKKQKQQSNGLSATSICEFIKIFNPFKLHLYTYFLHCAHYIIITTIGFFIFFSMTIKKIIIIIGVMLDI